MHISRKVLINVKIVEIRHQDTTEAVRGVAVPNHTSDITQTRRNGWNIVGSKNGWENDMVSKVFLQKWDNLSLTINNPGEQLFKWSDIYCMIMVNS